MNLLSLKRLLQKNMKQNQRVTVLAVVVKGGAIVSIGTNDYYRQKYRFKQWNKYNDLAGLHAELSAIFNCRKEVLNGATMVIIGGTRSGNEIISSKPCEGCMNAIREVGIRKLIYFDGDEMKKEKV